MRPQYVSATLFRKNNPLFNLELNPDNAVGQAHEGVFEQTTEVSKNPRDGTEQVMSRVTTIVEDIQFSKSEQFVTYPNGRIQKEQVYWDTALQIYYWQSQTDQQWYFEDPRNADAITQAGPYQKLLRQLERRQFWWLEANEAVRVTQNPDGRKVYAYKGLNDPTQITKLLDEEAQQAWIDSEKPVSKWKALALSAMTLVGNSMGFQSWVKSAAGAADPKRFEQPASVETPLDDLPLPSTNLLATYKSTETETAALRQFPLSDLAYPSSALMNGLQFGSMVAAGVASMIHPKVGREQSLFRVSKLLMGLGTIHAAEGYQGVKENKQSLSLQPTTALKRPETFNHVFEVSTLPDEASPLTPMYPNPPQAAPVSVILAKTLVDTSPVLSFRKLVPVSNRKIAISPLVEMPVPMAVVPPPVLVQAEAMLSKPVLTLMNGAKGQPAQKSFSKPVPSVTEPASVLTPLAPLGLNILWDVIRVADDTAQEIERCILQIQAQAVAQDEKSIQEKARAVQKLQQVGLALFKTSDLLKTAEHSPDGVMDIEISHQAKILEDAFTDANAYFTSQGLELPLRYMADLKDNSPIESENFLSTVSSAIRDIDSKTVGILVGSIIGAISIVAGVSVAASLMLSGRFPQDSPRDGSRLPLLASSRNRGASSLKTQLIGYKAALCLGENSILHQLVKSTHDFRVDALTNSKPVAPANNVASALFVHSGKTSKPQAAVSEYKTKEHAERLAFRAALATGVSYKEAPFNDVSMDIMPRDMSKITDLVQNTALFEVLKKLDSIDIYTERQPCDYSNPEPDAKGCLYYFKSIKSKLPNTQITIFYSSESTRGQEGQKADIIQFFNYGKEFSQYTVLRKDIKQKQDHLLDLKEELKQYEEQLKGSEGESRDIQWTIDVINTQIAELEVLNLDGQEQEINQKLRIFCGNSAGNSAVSSSTSFFNGTAPSNTRTSSLAVQNPFSAIQTTPGKRADDSSHSHSSSKKSRKKSPHRHSDDD